LEKEKDYKGAFEIHSAFAKNGVAYAQYSVGFQYEYGQGVPKNEKEAMKWYELAANQGIEGAKKQIKKIEEKRLAKAKQEKAKQEKAAKKAAKKAKFKKWMDEAEQYRSGAKELCADDENPSKCITNTSCVAAALILENPHDDRIKKFKKTAGGGLLSKGSLDKAMKELGKYAKKDESLKKTLLGLAMKCSLGSMF
jgi:TPR repeat protein